MSQITLQVSKTQKTGKKQEALRQIITNLINKKQQLNKQTFTRYEIDQEVIGVCLVSDKRSIENKFSLLWRLGYLIQPKPNEYDINLSKVSTLEESPEEVSSPVIIERAHTFSNNELICNSKNKVTLVQCRYWKPKAGLDEKEWHKCDTCAKTRNATNANQEMQNK